MTTNPPPGQHNHQTNTASAGGQVYANNGSGKLNVRNRSHTTIAGARSWAGWALLVTIGVDVAYFFYGAASYTGQPGNSGDLWRAGIFFVLLATTGTFLRRWLRRRL
jgi:hypothetical protein